MQPRLITLVMPLQPHTVSVNYNTGVAAIKVNKEDAGYMPRTHCLCSDSYYLQHEWDKNKQKKNVHVGLWIVIPCRRHQGLRRLTLDYNEQLKTMPQSHRRWSFHPVWKQLYFNCACFQFLVLDADKPAISGYVPVVTARLAAGVAWGINVSDSDNQNK